MRYSASAVILPTLIAGLAAQAPPSEPVDIERLGPRVGEVVPDLSAPDQFGRLRTLESIMGPNGAMLLFNRSVDW